MRVSLAASYTCWFQQGRPSLAEMPSRETGPTLLDVKRNRELAAG